MLRNLTLLIGVLLATVPAAAEEFTVVAFNVESGGTDRDVIADQLTTISGVEIWVLSEVQRFSWATTFDQALEDSTGKDHGFWISDSGGGDRLLILYDKTRLQMVDHFEIESINIGGGVRASLVVTFESKTTGDRFQVMANHLYRTRPDRRLRQARLLNEWIRDHPELPIINAGDFNFDWDAENGDQDHGPGYDKLTEDDRWKWVRPGTLIRTQCSFNSVLDFVFTGNGAQSWSAASEILFPEADYCPDTNATSDHRPVLAQFETTTGDGPPDDDAAFKALVLSKIRELEQKLEELKTLVDDQL